MIDIKKFLKGIGILNNSDLSKRLTFQVSDSSSPNTNFTVQSVATADRTLTLPDASGTLLLTAGSLTPNRALVSDGSGAIDDSTVTTTELNTLSGVTSSIQTQLNTKVQTASNVGAGSDVFKQKTGVDLEFRSLVAGSNVSITENTNDITISVSGGVNSTLSNLTAPTAINQDLRPSSAAARDLGATGFEWGSAHLRNILFYNSSSSLVASLEHSATSPSGASLGIQLRDFSTDGLGINSENSGAVNATPTASILIESGNKTAGTGNSGNILLQTGTSVGGARGSVNLNGSAVQAMAQTPVRFMDADSSNYVALIAPTTVSSNVTWTLPNADGTSGQVLTTDGTGLLSWASAGGGGGANTTLSNLTSPTNINQDLIGNPGTANWEIRTPGAGPSVSTGILMSTGPSTNETGIIAISTGSATGGQSGSISLSVGSGAIPGSIGLSAGDKNAVGASAPGNISLEAGSNSAGDSWNGGQIYLTAGNSGSGAFGGSILLETGTGNLGPGSISLDAHGTGFIQTNARWFQLSTGTSNPSSPVAGSSYFNTATNSLMIYNGTTWRTIAST